MATVGIEKGINGGDLLVTGGISDTVFARERRFPPWAIALQGQTTGGKRDIDGACQRR